ncbi:hypothetical protein GCM10010260_00730 [Streptomyces filipinensis]|uniref:Uncharacterized protein n=1 Tax=Streptomyces filipinensis TaxID=66887 RepID=A0A918I5E0_9ACTN|nr:hypothetical protein GCM10010260_00730 [Streptomyces filipinensis]
MASGLTGALLGFLFGIPRSLRGRPQVSDNEANSPDAGGYRSSTNPEEVSDWLTKIIVGVGLIQLGSATGALGRLIRAVGAALGGTPSARVVGHSPTPVRDQVAADLRVVKKTLPKKFESLMADSAVRAWLERNNMAPESL